MLRSLTAAIVLLILAVLGCSNKAEQSTWNEEGTATVRAKSPGAAGSAARATQEATTAGTSQDSGTQASGSNAPPAGTAVDSPPGGGPNAGPADTGQLDPAVMATVRALLIQMSSEANIERRAGSEGLDEMGPSVVDPYLTAALERGTESEKRGASAYLISRVALQDDAMVTALIGALSSTDDVLRHNAFQAIERVSHEQLSRALPQLIEWTKNRQEDNAYRVRGVRAIAKLGAAGRAAVPTLRELAGDDAAPDVQRAAYDAIGKVATAEEAERFFVDVLQNNPTMELRRLAAKRLVQAAVSPHSLTGLIAAFKDSHAEVRNEVSNSLVAIGRPAVPQLVQALQDPDVYIRRRAAQTLGKLNNVAVEAVPALQERLQDADPQVRALAAKSLELIQGR
ncbi:MAG: HEAT repeat domain-containing protein [Pirellulaceae bacterium]